MSSTVATGGVTPLSDRDRAPGSARTSTASRTSSERGSAVSSIAELAGSAARSTRRLPAGDAQDEVVAHLGGDPLAVHPDLQRGAVGARVHVSTRSSNSTYWPR